MGLVIEVSVLDDTFQVRDGGRSVAYFRSKEDAKLFVAVKEFQVRYGEPLSHRVMRDAEMLLSLHKAQEAEGDIVVLRSEEDKKWFKVAMEAKEKWNNPRVPEGGWSFIAHTEPTSGADNYQADWVSFSGSLPEPDAIVEKP
jgi:hypothetical protein